MQQKLITSLLASLMNDFLVNFLIEESCGGTVAGIDESGRGPLAGPVVAACVVLNPNDYPTGINDSKKLTAKKRVEIFQQLKAIAKFGIGIVDEKTIDKINILNATKLAMCQAWQNLCQKYQFEPDSAIVDGNFVPDIQSAHKAIQKLAVIKGDQKSLSIAAASIVAKETRDQIMLDLHKKFPDYGWDKNKGYPTKLHFDQIAKFGTCKHHRLTFNLAKSI